MGRVTRSSFTDKENTPHKMEKTTRLRSGKTPMSAVTPRKALGDIDRNVVSTPRLLTPGKKAVKRESSERSAAKPGRASKTVLQTEVPVAVESSTLDVFADEVTHALAPEPARSVSVATPAAEQSDCPLASSVRPPSCQQLDQDEWECLQMTADPDHVAFWWRAAEERREALKELIEENIQVHQQNHLLKQELHRLRVKESEASYFSLMARLWELESSAVKA